ncbi:A disintegrin and metalloproteinase with thrombospondin motifs 9 [Branchiostoma belcheri]|nr:A disintegrin and metalloproteinase with thrombospondin motifs 9 [Branchiostoma belcheri]
MAGEKFRRAALVVLSVLGAVKGSRSNRCSCPWGLWGSWTSCSQGCDGDGHLQHPQLLQLHLEGLGPLEQLFTYMWRSSDSETMSCNTQPCCRCEWGDWHTWSSCSQTCGEGTQTRTRYSQPCCFPSHHVDSRSCHNHFDNQGGTTSTFWNRERLILTVLGVLAGVALVASLVRYKLVWDRDRVVDLRGKL